MEILFLKCMAIVINWCIDGISVASRDHSSYCFVICFRAFCTETSNINIDYTFASNLQAHFYNYCQPHTIPGLVLPVQLSYNTSYYTAPKHAD